MDQAKHQMVDVGCSRSRWRLAPVLLAILFPASNLGAQTVINTEGVYSNTARGRIEQASAREVSQKIQLSVTRQPLRDVLRAIGAQSDRQIVFDNSLPQLSRLVTVQIGGMDVSSAIATAIRGTGLVQTTAKDGNTIVIRALPSDITEKRDTTQKKYTIMGIVVDSATNKPVSGVTVTIGTLQKSAVTGDNGEFVLEDIGPGEYTVSTKIFGYRTKAAVVTVPNQSSQRIKIAIPTTATQLSGVVTTATGTQRRVEVGHDVVVLNVDSIMQVAPVATIADLLVNRVPGVTAPLTSGEPGASRLVRIRGANSINASNDPMVIVDGIQIYATQIPVQRASGSEATERITGDEVALSPLDQIDPNSIAKLEVLKGASAVATYGSNAANGVIIITTKRGRSGPSRWSAMIQQGIEYIPGEWPDNYYAWGTNVLTRATMHCPIKSRISGCTVDSVTKYQLLNDSYTTILGVGHKQAYTASVSGGSDAIRYSVTGSINNTLGLAKLSDADQAIFKQRGWSTPSDIRRPQANVTHAGTATLDMQIGQYSVGITSNLSSQQTRKTPLSEVIGQSAFTPPSLDSFDASGNLIERGSATLSKIPDIRRRTRGQVIRNMNSVRIIRTFFDFVSSELTGGFDLSSRTDAMFLGRNECFITIAVTCDNTGQAMNRQQRTLSRNISLLGSTNPIPLGMKSVSVVFSAGTNYYRLQSERLGAEGNGLPLGSTSMNQAEIGRQTYLRDDQITAGAYIGMRFNLFDQMYFPFEIRQDAGSALSRKSQPTFPKLSFSYLLSDNTAFKNLSVSKYIDEFRIRTSYGRAGRQPSTGANMRTYSMKGATVDGVFSDIAGIAGVGNTNLVPERAEDIDYGFELFGLSNRVQLNATWYNSTTKDLLVTDYLPLSVGGGNRQINLGDVKSRGTELTLVTIPIENRSVVWSLAVSYASTKQRLTRIGGIYSAATTLTNTSPTQVINNYNRVGYPLRGMWARPLIAFDDIDGDGNIILDEVQFADSAMFIGTQTPKFESNIDQTITLFGKVTVNVTGKYKSHFTRGTRTDYDSDGGYLWARNDPRASLSEQAYEEYSALAKIQTLSSFTWDQLAINWIIPKQYTTRLLGRQKSLTLSMIGTNLGLWTNFRHKDPNIAGLGQLFSESSGPSAGALPTPRTWSITARIH